MRTVTSALWNGLKVFLVFTFCTVMFYYGILWVLEEYQGDERFEEPEGNAIKVFDPSVPDNSGFYERLWYIWQRGE